jgi:hypothetical protein
MTTGRINQIGSRKCKCAVAQRASLLSVLGSCRATSVSRPGRDRRTASHSDHPSGADRVAPSSPRRAISAVAFSAVEPPRVHRASVVVVFSEPAGSDRPVVGAIIDRDTRSTRTRVRPFSGGTAAYRHRTTWMRWNRPRRLLIRTWRRDAMRCDEVRRVRRRHLHPIRIDAPCARCSCSFRAVDASSVSASNGPGARRPS